MSVRMAGLEASGQLREERAPIVHRYVYSRADFECVVCVGFSVCGVCDGCEVCPTGHLWEDLGHTERHHTTHRLRHTEPTTEFFAVCFLTIVVLGVDVERFAVADAHFDLLQRQAVIWTSPTATELHAIQESRPVTIQAANVCVKRLAGVHECMELF